MTQEQFESLYSACYMRVFSYAMTLTGEPGQAEEITQESFFRAFSKLGSYRGDAEALTWLCAIAKNLFLDEKRRERKRGELPEELTDIQAGPAQAAEDQDSSFRIHLALHALEEPYREVFELRVFGELSFREIGMIFQKTENWARVTFHRAKLKLRERMDER